jgi:hypothetical protein
MREAAMPDPVDALILDLLEWIGPGLKPYAEVMAASSGVTPSGVSAHSSP